eukprot:scaffold2298_cov104-Skeletonema_dohrnii-CCMP3373.AAC.5
MTMPMHVYTCTKELGEAEFEDEDTSEYTTYFTNSSTKSLPIALQRVVVFAPVHLHLLML